MSCACVTAPCNCQDALGLPNETEGGVAMDVYSNLGLPTQVDAQTVLLVVGIGMFAFILFSAGKR